MDPGNDHEDTKRVGRREVVYLPSNKPEGLYFRVKPSFLAICLVISVLFIALLNEKMSRDAAVVTGFFSGESAVYQHILKRFLCLVYERNGWRGKSCERVGSFCIRSRCCRRMCEIGGRSVL